MSLLQNQVPKPALPEVLDKLIETYLMMLAQTRPFHLEISAPVGQVFEELSANWPPIEGWGAQVNVLIAKIRTLAEGLYETGGGRHFRLSVSVSKTPPMPTLDPHEPTLLMALDVMEGTMLHQILMVDQNHYDPLFDHVELGLLLTLQPFDSDGDARAIGFGMIPVLSEQQA